jgi:endonuclease/exonuclease/phosphatase family metal-dependent hydrolase
MAGMGDRTATVSYQQDGRPLRVATYNVHKCRGLDRRVLPGRVAQVIAELDADVVALQEVVAETGDDPNLDQLGSLVGELTGYGFCFGENRRLKNGAPYGNAILSRLPLVANQNYYLPLTRREQRGCLRADLEMEDGRILHVFNVHLGTGFMERRHQGPRLLSNEILRHAGLTGPRIVLGDFNEWTRGLTTQLMKPFKALTCAPLPGGNEPIPACCPCCTSITSTSTLPSRSSIFPFIAAVLR